MRGPELVLVRHGRTAWNASRKFMGRSDIALDDVGLAQALALSQASWVPRVQAVFASPLRRALQTARALHPAAVATPGLEELDQGELEGMLVPDAIALHGPFFAAWSRDPTGVPVPGGESLDAGRDRAWDALCRVASQHSDGDTVVVVSHQLVLSAVMTRVTGAPLSDWRRFSLDHTASHRVRWDAAGPQWIEESLV